MRALTIALSTLAALAVQELAYTRTTSPNANPKKPQPGELTAQDDLDALDQTMAIAGPEVLPVTPLGKEQPASPSPRSLQPTTVAVPQPPTVTSSTPQKMSFQPINVESLPIDQIINDSLQVTKPLATREVPPKQAAEAKKPPLSDIEGHWAQTVITALAEKKVVQGYEDGQFHPDDPVTEAQFHTMATKALPEKKVSLDQLRQKLPDRVITRADAAAFIYQAMVATPSSIARSPENPGVKVAAAEELGGLPSFAPSPESPSNPTLVSQSFADPPGITAQAQDYVLGAGDTIRLEVFDVPEYSKEYRVLVNGTLNLPLVGNVSIEGLSLQQAGNLLSSRYEPYLTRPRVTVTLVAARPLNVAIAGEINRPGSYTVSPAEGSKFPTVTRLVQLAGGMTQSADLKQVEIRRPQRSGSDQVIRVDLWQLIREGNLRQDISLRDGDMIFVPAAREVDLVASSQLASANFATDPAQPLNIAVVGQVARPGPHTLVRSESAGGLPTVTKAIQKAGGITQLANIRQVEVRRMTRSGNEQAINVDLWQLLREGDLQQDLVLQQGDTVVIPTATTANAAEATELASASFSPNSIRVNVVGEVVSPGAIEVTPNTPLNQALLSAGGFNNRARKKSVQLIRLNPNGTVSQQAISVDLGASINDQNNPMLRNNDIIVVGRSTRTQISDTLDGVLGPLGRLLPLVLLF